MTTDRCPGSLQTVMVDDGKPTRCPVCNKPTTTVPLDGRPVLVEHRRRDDEALPMGMFA